eukprot:CAMPEP_0179130846 /NCGR_PEP_ID=MMETSP0796-20121207/62134_1 /TAXON_ID=73915 /ORGANISM="Pyrodinium bahamense, Strain pbaha01" /LENGTH=442 /DNA_ID=CAMNT_0020829757 /DNA_START=3 /DNA_END=1327 /DNA_ORIENTATION=+
MALALDLGALNSRLSREGAQSGDITASLIWNDPADLDLHAEIKVKGKGNAVHLFYGNKKAANGYLDVDMNVQDSGKKFSLEPVENIFWKSPPGGHYRIFVTNACTKSSDTKWDGKFSDPKRSIDFKVFLNKDGEMQTFSGCWKPGDSEITCFEFDLDGPAGTGGGGNYLVFPPESSKTTFKELCEKHGVTWKVGCGFYAVAKKETIQAGKEMLLQDIEADTFTVGSEDCRAKLGWPAAGELKKGPSDILAGHRLFVQSTSYNRAIPPDTHVLFEVDAEEYAKHRKARDTTFKDETHTAGTAGMSAAAKAKAKAEAAAAKAKAEAKAKAGAKARGKAKAEPAAPKAGAKRAAPPAEAEPKAKARAKAKASLAGKKIVFTGTLSTPRAAATNAAKEAGATVLSAVSGNMDILVAGEGAGAKKAKAEELGKEVWDEAAFKRAAGL